MCWGQLPLRSRFIGDIVIRCYIPAAAVLDLSGGEFDGAAGYIPGAGGEGNGTTNYEGTAPVKVDVTIGKANYTGLMTASTSCKYGRDKTYDMSDLLPEGYVLGTITITDTNSIFEGTPTVSGAMLTYGVDYGNGIDVQIGDSHVCHGDGDRQVKRVVIGGFRHGNGDRTGAVHLLAVIHQFVGQHGSAHTFTPNNTDLYGASTGTVVVTISKATPSLILTPSPATLPNGGMVTLTLSGLPDRSSATVTCSDENITVTKGSGNTWTAELPAGGASYTFAASYAGDGNHNHFLCLHGAGCICPVVAIVSCVGGREDIVCGAVGRRRLPETSPQTA